MQAGPESPKEAAYELVQDLPALERWVAAAQGRGIVALHSETTSLDPLTAELVGISLATAAGQACYVPVGHSVGKAAAGGLDFESAAAPPTKTPPAQAPPVAKQRPGDT